MPREGLQYSFHTDCEQPNEYGLDEMPESLSRQLFSLSCIFLPVGAF